MPARFSDRRVLAILPGIHLQLAGAFRTDLPMPFRRLLPPFALFAVLIAAVQAAAAPIDDLKQLYRLALSAEACGFDITPRQSDAMGKAMDQAIEAAGLNDEKSEKLMSDIEHELDAKGWEKLCADNGDWAKTFAAEMDKFAK